MIFDTKLQVLPVPIRDFYVQVGCGGPAAAAGPPDDLTRLDSITFPHQDY